MLRLILMMRATLFILLPLLLQPAATGRGSIHGEVVALGTSSPVARAHIVAALVGGTAADYRTAVADGRGRFVLADLPPGSYRIHAERQGYVRGEHGRRTAPVAGLPVQVTAGSAAVVAIALIPTAVITGRVVDDGRPAPHVWVRAMRSVFVEGERTLQIAAYASTDDLGEYRLFGLTPGTYVVSALPPERPRIEGDTYVVPTIPSNANGNRSQIRTAATEALSSGHVDPAAFEGGLFVPVYYPGTTDPVTAVPLELHPGQTVAGIDLSVARTRAVRIRGRVIDGATGQPARDAVVNVAPQAGGTTGIPGAIVSEGRFELAVPPGRYELFARSTMSVRLFGTTFIEAADRDVEDVQIVIRPGTTVTGRLTIVDAPARLWTDPSSVTVQLLGIGGMTGYSAVRVQPDGTFSVQNVEPRDYRVRIMQGGRVLPARSARYGADDVLNDPIRVRPETAEAQLEIAIGLATGTLDVTVVGANQRPVAGMAVSLVPEPPRRRESSLYRTVATDAFGRVHMDDVVPGDYRLFAADVDPAAWRDPDVIRRHESRGTVVSVRPDGRHQVQLRVAP